MSTLQDLGERRIISDILPRFVTGMGDDCAVLEDENRHIVITTDPVPTPAANVIGGDTDPYWMGWLLVVINASDLAASGAAPMAFLAAIEAPPSLPQVDFERLLAGIRDGCTAEGLAYVGGNLREARVVAAVGTAVGIVSGYQPIRRSGARDGDVVVSIGGGGRFWRDALHWKILGLEVAKADSPLFRPLSQGRAVRELASAGLLRCAMDNSDGLLPTLTELARLNGLGFCVDVASLVVRDCDPRLGVDASKLWLGWGDWNIVGAIDRRDISQAREIVEGAGQMFVEIGSVTSERVGAYLRRGSRVVVAPRLESERFAKDSWFAQGIDGYIRELLEVPLP